MTILFDIEGTQPSNSGKRHGGGKYGEVIFNRIVERRLPVVAYCDKSRWLNPIIKEIIDKNNIKIAYKHEGTLNDIIKKNNIDIFYSPVMNDEKLSVTSCPVIVTIHGIRALELRYDPFIWKYKSVSLSEKIKFLIKYIFPKFGYRHAYDMYLQPYKNNNISFVMVSNHSVNSLLSYCPQYRNTNIKCFYSPSTSVPRHIERKYSYKYFLLVSGNRWEKNNLRSVIALDRLFSNGLLDGFKVKITGINDGNAFKYDIKNIDKFEFCGYVEDHELEQLYHDSYCLIYMSLNEGFGYPPLEAMYYGTPCIVSPFTSIPEVCGSAVLYANPLSIEEIMSRILILKDDRTHNYLSKLAKKQSDRIRAKQNKDLDSFIDYLYS